MTLLTRSKSISRLVEVEGVKEGPLEAANCCVLEHLLRLRLDGEPKLDWLMVDQGLFKALAQARGSLSPSKAVLDAITQKLESSILNELDGTKVRLSSYSVFEAF